MSIENRRTSWRLIALLLWLTGCASVGTPVTGPDPQAPTWKGSQSETAISYASFGGRSVITVAFNDENTATGKIQFTSSSRTVFSGASLMGWAFSEDDGASWKYGGTVTPTAEWPILWGDPGITGSGRDQRFVFMSSLAVPAHKVPAAGIDGSLVAFVGGACIARSTDGGRTFSVYQCVHNNFEFYDGGSMASSTAGDIYASFIATDSGRYDIWHAKGEGAPFVKLPDPFPSCRMAMHPRIRVGYPGLSAGGPDPSLFVAGQIIDCDRGTFGADQNFPGGFGQIIINRFHAGSWGTPRAISKPSAVNPEVFLSDRTLRTGPQFSFDVGAPTMTEDPQQELNDHIRMLYTMRQGDKGRLWVEGSFCKFDLSELCHPAPEWGSTPGIHGYEGDQFTPNVRAFPGFLLIPPAWLATFVSRDHDPAGNTVKIRRGAPFVLPNGARILVSFNLTNPFLVCSDLRPSGGYWGDYDDLQFIGFVKNSTTARFLRTFTDSSAGCVKRWDWTSEHVHVRSVPYP